MHILFICSRNQWRSPTAEKIWRHHPGIATRSAGTSPNAKHTVSLKDIDWATMICVMEEKHKTRLKSDFRQALQHKAIHVLDIPDDYAFMDPELIELLKQSVGNILGVLDDPQE